MRISGWFLGVIAFILLIAATGLCAFTSYAFTREQVINLWDSGVQVESPLEVVQALNNPDSLVAPTATSAPATATTVVATAVATATQQVELVATSLNVEPTTVGISIASAATIPPPTPTVDPVESLRWNDPRQVRILLMGIDQRAGVDTERAYRTDTMILINVDPVRNTAAVISFPRDLWVTIPNYNTQERINTANYIGDLNAYPGGGPALAMETLRSAFGLRVDYFVQVNFTVFERVVDILAPRGVEVCPAERIFDAAYPDGNFGIMTIEFPAGCQRLGGTQLLQYARTRHGNSDFDRARRQQEVLDSVRQELLSAGGIQNFITQIPALFNELSDNFRTDLSVDQIIGLGLEINEIETVNYLVVGEQYVNLGKNPAGDDVLFPVYGRISDAIQRVLFPEQGVTQGDLRVRAEAENMPIYVYNGTTVSGLAGRTREWLIGNHRVVVTDVGNTSNPVTASEIRIYGGIGDATAEWLSSILNIPPSRIVPGTDGLIASGVMVVAGPDMPATVDQ